MLAFAGALCACAPAAPAASATPSATPISTPTPTSTPTPSTPALTGTPTPSSFQCLASGLQVKLSDEQGAAGTIHAEYEVRSADGTCVLNGYPGVVMLNPSGGALTTSVQDESGTTPRTVTLPPGTAPDGAVGATGHGWFTLSWNDSQCAGSQANIPTTWRFSLPGAAGTVDVSARDQSGALPVVCNGALTVGPLQNTK